MKTLDHLFWDIESLYDIESGKDINVMMIEYTVHYYGKNNYSSHIIEAIENMECSILLEQLKLKEIKEL